MVIINSVKELNEHWCLFIDRYSKRKLLFENINVLSDYFVDWLTFNQISLKLSTEALKEFLEQKLKEEKYVYKLRESKAR